MELEERVAKLEKTVEILEKALVLTQVASQPAIEWMDSRLEELRG